MQAAPIGTTSPLTTKPFPQESEQKGAVQKIALEALAELAASLSVVMAMNAICSLSFLASPFLNLVAIQLIANTVLRSARAYSGWHWLSWVEASTFSVCTALNGHILIHEMGHAITANKLFRNAKAHVQIFPLQFRGFTPFCPKELSSLGAKLGRGRAWTLFRLAGPALSLSIASVLLKLGFVLREKYPQLSKHLIIAATIDFLYHAYGALRSHLFPGPCGDYLLTGIHPLAAATAYLSVVAYSIFSNASSSSKETPSSLALSYLEPGSSPTST